MTQLSNDSALRAIAMLQEPPTVEGAHLEVHIAHRLGMRVVAFGELFAEVGAKR